MDALSGDKVPVNSELDVEMMTQYGMSEGLRMFGEQGAIALQMEMQQLQDKNGFKAKGPKHNELEREFKGV